MRTIIILAAALMFAGCYKYVPIAEAPIPGDEVRVRLTSEAALEREKTTGVLVREVEGKTMGSENGSFALELPGARSASDFQGAFNFKNTLQLERTDIESYELRMLDRTKTYGMVAGAAIITGILVTRALSGAGGDGPPNLGEGQNPNVDGISLFRIPIGW